MSREKSKSQIGVQSDNVDSCLTLFGFSFMPAIVQARHSNRQFVYSLVPTFRVMASPFHPQLACAEERFISSLLQGPEAVQAFYLFWSGLQANFSKAVQEERVDKDTLELAHQVVPRVEIITKQFLELHQGAESLALSLHDGLDATFANLDLGAQLSPSRKPGRLAVICTRLILKKMWNVKQETLFDNWPTKVQRHFLLTLNWLIRGY